MQATKFMELEDIFISVVEGGWSMSQIHKYVKQVKMLLLLQYGKNMDINIFNEKKYT